jgi:heterodisulfide reductase subunit C
VRVPDTDLERAFLTELAQVPGGARIARCLQCGTCTGSCPVAPAMDISPRRMIARYRAGDIGAVLRSTSIWLCASCYGCTTRCPAGIKVTDMVYALKRLAVARGLTPDREPVFAFPDTFTTIVERYGRNNEPRMMLAYFRRAGLLGLLRNAGTALRLLRRGRLPLRASRIRGLAQLRAMIRRAEALEPARAGAA